MYPVDICLEGLEGLEGLTMGATNKWYRSGIYDPLSEGVWNL